MYWNFLGDWKKAEKIFYISLQRSGTKSFSEFFRRNNYRVASWRTSNKNNWSKRSLAGQYLAILDSADFRRNQVFEDGPWHHVELVRFLYWYLPKSRFVYFDRPFEDWLASMKKHSKGRTPGNPKYHCIVYDRLEDYYAQKDDGIEPNLRIEGGEEFYERAFKNHALQVRAFFEDKPRNRFFRADLYDAAKFEKLNEAWGLKLDFVSDVHIHKSGQPRKKDFA